MMFGNPWNNQIPRTRFNWTAQRRIYLHPLVMQENFNYVWSNNIWKVAGAPMKVFKWTPNFTFKEEPSVVPVWVNLPGLHVHLFNHNALFPICLHNATLRKSRPHVARICIEVDLFKPMLTFNKTIPLFNKMLNTKVFPNIVYVDTFLGTIWRFAKTQRTKNQRSMKNW